MDHVLAAHPLAQKLDHCHWETVLHNLLFPHTHISLALSQNITETSKGFMYVNGKVIIKTIKLNEMKTSILYTVDVITFISNTGNRIHVNKHVKIGMNMVLVTKI